jgi:hypothetical protein
MPWTRYWRSPASRPVGDIASYADEVVSEASPDTGDDACLVVVHVR